MLKLTKDQEVDVADQLKNYFKTNTECEFSQVEVLHLIDFLNEHIGKYYYNQGIVDAEVFMNDRISDLVMLEK